MSNDTLSLAVTQAVGPRILSLRLEGGENLFAELPDHTLDCPGVGPFHLYGGHRLWHAPEDARRTYLPDDDPVEVTQMEGGLLVQQPAHPETGIEKTLHIQLGEGSALVIVDHHLSNKGLWPVETAPWVLTMLKPGGIAILPQNSEPADKAGLLPNRNLVLWRYTDMESPYISWGNRYIFVNASLERGSLKLGFPNPRRWLAYFWNGTLFVKYAAYNPERAYFDMGSSSQCYCGPDFIELETLGPRTLIPPGGSITHREVWRVFGDVTFSPEEIAAEQFVHDLDLESGAAYSLL